MQFASGALAMVVAGDAAGVARWAHVGGFVAGMALAHVIRRRRSYPRVWADQYAPW
jgi:membrane associated rhomboid family serine protease